MRGDLIEAFKIHPARGALHLLTQTTLVPEGITWSCLRREYPRDWIWSWESTFSHSDIHWVRCGPVEQTPSISRQCKDNKFPIQEPTLQTLDQKWIMDNGTLKGERLFILSPIFAFGFHGVFFSVAVLQKLDVFKCPRSLLWELSLSDRMNANVQARKIYLNLNSWLNQPFN